jgi:formylglycine-generating enzyme required for sulfatase activity
MVIGRGTGGEAVVAARSVTFGGAAEAHLPNDTTHGFVTFAPGTFVFAAGVDDWRKPPESRLPAGQNITLGDLLVAKYEVTVAQYRQCATEGACRPTDPRAVDGPDEWPVRHVSWVEATQYCAWLEQKLASIDPAFVNRFGAGLHVTLPSEPEWERAAGDRGVEGYPWKGPLSPARANYAASGRLSPVPVGEFTAGATAEGIHDLSGNVAEWTRSEFRQYPYDAADGREEPNPRVTTRVVRGGSFYDAETLLRVTARQAADPASGYASVGFRVVITRVQPGAGGQSQSAPPAAAR